MRTTGVRNRTLSAGAALLALCFAASAPGRLSFAQRTTLEETDEPPVTEPAYAESLCSNLDFAKHEAALFEILQRDSILAELFERFVAEVGKTPGTEDRLVAEDSLLSAEPELSRRMMELEAAAAEQAGTIQDYGEQIFRLWSRPVESLEFFSDADGPYYPGSDEGMVNFVYYLERSPRLFAAYRNLFDYLRKSPEQRRKVFPLWRWYGRRDSLWFSMWRYRLRAVGSETARNVVWARRTFLGSRPRLARMVLRNHSSLALEADGDPELWSRCARLARRCAEAQ